MRRINALPEVVSATPVKPDATQPFTRSFHLARVEANANPAALLAALSAMPEVTDAEIPPRRGLSVPPGSAPDDA